MIPRAASRPHKARINTIVFRAAMRLRVHNLSDVPAVEQARA
jgi:hypothetical protein